MPTREEAKAIRKSRILDAARDLIRETEQTGFSMRALAARSDVSLVTPYNLFGSKQAIMSTLLDEDIGTYGAELRRSRRDPLDIFFRAVTLGRDYFDRDQNYYRAVLAAVYNEGGRDYRSMFRGPRRALWRQLVETAVAEGYLLTCVNTDALAAQLALTFFANILEWVAGEMSLKEMELRTHYGFALALYAMATHEHSARMRERILTAQRRLGASSRHSGNVEAQA